MILRKRKKKISIIKGNRNPWQNEIENFKKCKNFKNFYFRKFEMPSFNMKK